EEETGDDIIFQEGCLSIPGIREDVKRKSKIRISYYDRNMELHEEWFDGWKARIIQHEYDHLEGILFTDNVSLLRKKMLKAKLNAVSNGAFDASYKVKINRVKR
ncbi:MAG TPA: peptide deformylase, partial [Bacteroidales bacterium]|nr:peptide deformylase [Bacteroidales bacterium]